ncbi:hypothetical protein P879_08494 [Paragonimus westermani]|uniref:TATA box-binding protein-associated factor RNA polymerase I subunit A n=1 Tax=Paragonimus westermani TaxID=34504 RepID=A0A8T0DKE3_9TREM|nr:hypothetical protein P879_08494 [Paragonimus westermani]
MEHADFNFGKRKLYFLRLRRICQVLQCAKTEGLSQQWLGHHSFSVLAAAEDFRVISPSVKRRIFCLMWHLLSKHRFLEAARLLAHTIHTHPFPPSWIWRIAFHLFRCLDRPENFRKFNHALDQFRLADENNRVLERIMHHMVRGEFLDAHNCRSLKLTHRDRYTSSGSVLTREPEFDHVQRLQHLYEGLCFYCLWLKHLHSHGDDPDEQATADELAERAFYRLQEVEALVLGGQVCDVFIRPLVEILEYFCEPHRARTLLLSYARHLPENPNTIRYLCEWYKRRLTEPEAVCDSSISESTVAFTDTTPADPVAIKSSTPKALTTSKNTKRLLRYRIKLSKHVLPEPAPIASGPLSAAEERQLLRANHPHVSTIISCLKNGFYFDALDISFLLLDHPSWAVYNEPWKLLRKSIETVGKQRPEVVEAISVRRRIWLQIHFQLKHLPLSAQKVEKLFSSSTPIAVPSRHNSIGPLLTVQSFHVYTTEMNESSAMETST